MIGFRGKTSFSSSGDFLNDGAQFCATARRAWASWRFAPTSDAAHPCGPPQPSERDTFDALAPKENSVTVPKGSANPDNHHRRSDHLLHHRRHLPLRTRGLHRTYQCYGIRSIESPHIKGDALMNTARLNLAVA